MVLTVIAVYVICWLPYWLYQIIMLYVYREGHMPRWLQTFYQLITILSYANSAVNPILYAFLSDNFRRTFARAFGCATAAEVERVLKRSGQHQSEVMPDDGDGAGASRIPETLRPKSVSCTYSKNDFSLKVSS